MTRVPAEERGGEPGSAATAKKSMAVWACRTDVADKCNILVVDSSSE